VRNLLALLGIFLLVWVWAHGLTQQVVDDAISITKTGTKIIEDVIQKESNEENKLEKSSSGNNKEQNNSSQKRVTKLPPVKITLGKPSIPKELPHLNKKVNRQPRIVGSFEYEQVIRQALMRLYELDREDYHLVGYYLSEVRESDHSGVNVFPESGGIFYNKLANFSGQNLIIWEAGDMVHDATHCYLYKNGYEFVGKEAEEYCCRVQKRCLERLGAPSFMIDYIEKAASSGYWEIPFDQRGW